MTATGARVVVAVLVLALAGSAAAHSMSPEEIVWELSAPSLRDAIGVVDVARDEKTPRLLVLHVGERWYRLAPGVRRLQATDWSELWRHNVPEGIVAVLDERTNRPVVKFDGQGAVADVSERPAP